MENSDEILYEEPRAKELERERAKARAKRRITYDCHRARVKGDQVLCSHLDRRSLSLRSVLRGRSASVCQKCTYYDDEM